MVTLKTCCRCKVEQKIANFPKRYGRAGVLSNCRVCTREVWRISNLRRRGTLRGYCRVHWATEVEEAVQAIMAMIDQMSPTAQGVHVARKATGEIAYWQGAMKPPRGTVELGLFDFEAKAEWLREELA